MKCRNEACIYRKNGECTLEEISIDRHGFCEDCLIYEEYATIRTKYEADH